MQEAQTSAAALLFSTTLMACGGLQQDVPANPRSDGVAIVEARVEDESHYVLAGQRLQVGDYFWCWETM